jgi:predicted DNA-binding transcriptional regulator AlpA
MQCGPCIPSDVRTHTVDVATFRDAVGMREISDRLGYPEATIRLWRKTGVLPDPAVMRSRSPIWEWAEVLRWAHAAGRDDRLLWLA